MCDDEANKCKTYGQYNSWCLDRCNSRAHKLSNYVNIPKFNSDMFWWLCFCGINKSVRSEKWSSDEVVSTSEVEKKLSHFEVVRKRVKSEMPEPHN